jgi:flavin-dependent dehydrogenase
MHDVIVVGARCAGSPLAMLLAREGMRVLLVDRASFPADIPHGHFIHRHGPRRLREWGLLGKVAARTPAIADMLVDAGDFPLVARNLVEDDMAWGYGPRRTTLDQILIDAAAESGADVRPAFNVFEYIIENGTVAGIHARTQAGLPVIERGSLIVGADGRNSGLARPGNSLLLLFLLERRRQRDFRVVCPYPAAPHHFLVQDRRRAVRHLRRCSDG